MALLPVSDALERVLAQAKPLPSEMVPLAAAHGRVLASDLKALRTQPPADVSAMDGYAVRAADIAAAPVELKVTGEVAAGRPFAGTVDAGEAVRIFTGGVVPPGADTIAIQEHAERDGDRVRIQKTTPVNKHIRRAGLDFKAGDVLLAARPLSDRPRCDARGRHQQRDHSGHPPRQGRSVCDRRRTGHGGQRTRSRPDRLFQRLCRHGACARAKARR